MWTPTCNTESDSNSSHSWMCCWNGWHKYRKIYWNAVGDIFRLGGDICSCYCVSVCILFHLLVSLMHQVYIKIFCIRHQLLPEFSFHQNPENFHNSGCSFTWFQFQCLMLLIPLCSSVRWKQMRAIWPFSLMAVCQRSHMLRIEFNTGAVYFLSL